MTQISPVQTGRSVPDAARLVLWVRAAGRCEFDGCNRYLLEHSPSGSAGNFGEVAHIVAFREAGPRGKGQRPLDVHDPENLMLLCPACHKAIDDDPGRFPIRVCRDFKRAHEDRISRLTETAPNRRTVAFVVKAEIGGQRVDIALADMQAAVSPRYVLRPDVVTVDLSALPDRPSDSGWIAKREAVEKHARAVLERALEEEAPAHHISVFALAPMPLLIALGCVLSNKVPVALYQRHRETEGWCWEEGAASVGYVRSILQEGKDLDRVALVLSLSGTIHRNSLPAVIGDDYWIYELTLAERTPNPRFLRREADLEQFRAAYMEMLRAIAGRHGRLRTIELFPAVPAPVAVTVGRDLFPKVDPSLRLYDFDKHAEGFTFALEVNT